jgi:hypothetical protein
MALAGCGDLLEVENPNNVTEEAVKRLQGAAALVNGAEARVYAAVSQIWLPYLTVSDDLYWGADGSRDAWGSLDQGQIADPLNEFIDAYFPTVAQARWLADEAVTTVSDLITENPDEDGLNSLLATANLNAGIIYMIIGETMQEFAFSDKDVEGDIISAPEMGTRIFDPAIAYLSAALTTAQAEGNGSLAQTAQALRARALHSKAVREKIQPTPNTADPYVSVPGANADAAAVLASADADWQFRLSYSAATIDNTMAGWVNSRGEPLVNPTLSELPDLIDEEWLASAPVVDVFSVASDDFTPLILTSTRQMHLILAEAALAEGGAVEGGSFAEHINNLRALDGLTDFSGQFPDEEMLQFSRRAHLAIQGQRLADMYRFGLSSDAWLPTNTASQNPGFLVPIGCVEIRANSQLDDSPC